MAKTIAIQKIQDGYRNTVLKITGYVNAEDYTNQSVVNIANLGQIDGFGSKGTKLAVTNINYDIEDAIEVDLIWGGGTPAALWYGSGRGDVDAKRFGGITDNAGTQDGTILLTTKGGATGTTDLAFSLILELVKT